MDLHTSSFSFLFCPESFCGSHPVPPARSFGSRRTLGGHPDTFGSLGGLGTDTGHLHLQVLGQNVGLGRQLQLIGPEHIAREGERQTETGPVGILEGGLCEICGKVLERHVIPYAYITS